MAILEVIVYPHEVLSTPGHDVVEIDEDTRTFIENLTETMYSLNGVGLAANQVGDLRRICIIDATSNRRPDDRSGLLQLVNPHIVHREGEIRWEEGCLSFPDLYVDVVRSGKVAVEALDPAGKPIRVEGEGLQAVAMQHEIDHLDGVVFLDRISRLKRRLALRRYTRTLDATRRGEKPDQEAAR